MGGNIMNLDSLKIIMYNDILNYFLILEIY